MKRILMMVVAVMLLAVSFCFAGLKEAEELYKQKKYVDAEAEYRKVLPELEGAEKSSAQFHIGHCLQRQNKYDEAIAEYRKVASIPEASPYWISNAQFRIGSCLEAQKKYNEAIVEYQKVASIPEANPHHISDAQFSIGYCLQLQKKYDEAVMEYRKVASIPEAHPSHISSAQYRMGCCLEMQGKDGQEEFVKGCLVERAEVYWLKANFDKVKKTMLGKEAYKKLIDDMIFIIPATPENADFLGYLKSEIEKMK